MSVDQNMKIDLDEIFASQPPRPLYRALFGLAECYNSSSEQALASIKSTGNNDYFAPAIMCKSFAIELLLKFFIVSDYPSALSKDDINAAGINLHGHPYSGLFNRISASGQADIARKHSDRTGRNITPAEFKKILISLGDDPFVRWRYVYEKSAHQYLDMELLSMTIDSIGLAAQDKARKIEGIDIG